MAGNRPSEFASGSSGSSKHSASRMASAGNLHISCAAEGSSLRHWILCAHNAVAGLIMLALAGDQAKQLMQSSPGMAECPGEHVEFWERTRLVASAIVLALTGTLLGLTSVGYCHNLTASRDHGTLLVHTLEVLYCYILAPLVIMLWGTLQQHHMNYLFLCVWHTTLCAYMGHQLSLHLAGALVFVPSFMFCEYYEWQHSAYTPRAVWFIICAFGSVPMAQLLINGERYSQSRSSSQAGTPTAVEGRAHPSNSKWRDNALERAIACINSYEAQLFQTSARMSGPTIVGLLWGGPYIVYSLFSAAYNLVFMGDHDAAAWFSPSHLITAMGAAIMLGKVELSQLIRINMDRQAARAQELQERLTALRKDHEDMRGAYNVLLKEKEDLTIELHELEVALKNYQPTVALNTGTPADAMLRILSDCMQGNLPNMDDMKFVRNVIVQAYDIYSPVDIKEQLLAANFDADVNAELVRQLGMQQMSGFALVPPVINGSMEYDSFGASDDNLHEQGAEDALRVALLKLLLVDKKKSTSDQGSSSRRGSDCPSPTSTHSNLAIHGSANGRSGLLGPPRCTEDGRRAPGSENLASPASPHRRPLSTPTPPWSTTASGGDSTASTPTATATATNPSAPAPSLLFARRRMSAPLVENGVGQATPAAPVPPPMIEEVERVLATTLEWSFDSFELERVSQGRPLSTLAYYIFHESRLITAFKLKGVVLSRFLRRIEDGYPPNPYHNRTHAADVLRTMHIVLQRGGLVPGYADQLTLMACYLAAVIHDFEHFGLTNDYLIATKDLLALRYNDKAPMENHHLAAAFTMLCTKPGVNFLSELPSHEYDRLRKLTIELVLATDMKQHFSILSQFNTVHATQKAHTESPAGGPSPCPSLKVLKRTLTHENIDAAVTPSGDSERKLSKSRATSAFGSEGGSFSEIFVPADEAERVLSLQVALKLSDLGAMSANLEVHRKWVMSLEEEFFRQGDQEKANGLTVSPLFDRDKPGVSTAQVGFFDVVAVPLYRSFAQVFPRSTPLFMAVMRNYYWQAEQQASRKSSEVQLSASPSQQPSARASMEQQHRGEQLEQRPSTDPTSLAGPPSLSVCTSSSQAANAASASSNAGNVPPITRPASFQRLLPHHLAVERTPSASSKSGRLVSERQGSLSSVTEKLGPTGLTARTSSEREILEHQSEQALSALKIT